MDLLAYEALLPPVSDVNRPYFDGWSEGELRLQRCRSCATWRFPDSPVCPSCLSDSSSFEAVSGRGTLWSWIVMHQRYFEAFAEEVPYLVAFVRLEEGPFMMSTLVDPPADLTIGDALEVRFVEVGVGRPIPKFAVLR